MIGILEQNSSLNQPIVDRFFPIIDYSSYGLFYMHAPFRSQASATLNAGGAIRPYIIKRSTNVGDWYAVDFDANNTISYNSNARSNDTTPNERLGDILGVDNWDVVRNYSQLETNYYHSLALTNVGKLRFATGGVIETKGSVFSPRWLGVEGLEASAVKSQFSNGNDISILSVVSLSTDNGVGAIMCTGKNDGNVINHFIDRRTVKRNGYVFTSGSIYAADNLAQRNDSDFFVQAVTINGTTKKMKSYIDGVFQNEVTFTGTYTNNAFIIGSGNTLTNVPLNGHGGALLCGAQEWDATQVSNLTTIMKTQFNII